MFGGELSMLDFFKEDTWDYPFFKKLPYNDTGKAPGHQGGIVVPKDLREFFPILIGQTTSEHPTIDHQIKAQLFIDDKPTETVFTRYQIQSWGGTRSPESRITGNLGSLRNEADEDDFLIIQRSLDSLGLYRFCLIKAQSSSYKYIEKITKGQRWGVIGQETPMTQKDIILTQQNEQEKELGPFNPFDENIKHSESRSKRIARSFVFRETIQKIYENTCAICKKGLKSPNGPVEVTAAHIVPKSRHGSDDARNGISICRTHHWAFDNGLFSVDENRKIIVPKSILRIKENKPLLPYNGEIIKESTVDRLKADANALKWHRDNILIT